VRTDNGLRNAVIISLFTDRRAVPDDRLPAEDGDRRGCWMDMFDDHVKGSRLWLLDREKQKDDVPQRAEIYSKEGLAWLIDDGVASSIVVDAEWLHRGVLRLRVVIALPDDSWFKDVFDYVLEST
jgi:phage gp46-like protein